MVLTRTMPVRVGLGLLGRVENWLSRRSYKAQEAGSIPAPATWRNSMKGRYKGMANLLRRSVWAVSDGVCYWCNCGLEFETSTLDHLVPMGRGGHPTRLSNLVVACLRCNGAKGSNECPRGVTHQSRALIGWVWRHTDWIEKRKIEAIIDWAGSRPKSMCGRGSAIQLLIEEETPREKKCREYFNCEKAPRPGLVLKHGYPSTPILLALIYMTDQPYSIGLTTIIENLAKSGRNFA